MRITEKISKSIQGLLEEKAVFVFYKKPNSKYIKAIVQKNQKLYNTDDYTESGFVFAPFDETKNTVLIPKDQTDEFIFNLPKPQILSGSSSHKIAVKKKRLHYRLVLKCIKFIEEGHANKIVVSHVMKQKINQKNIGELYENLIQAYPGAFVYLWYHPKVGLWLGATPEKLLNVNKNKFSTMALAGTQVYKENIFWKEKEIDEQKWVSDYIFNQLKPLSKHIKSSESFTHKAGHLAHIRTDIIGELAKEISLKKLINTLHPTPAVCGTPKDITQKFILENEGYDREFYTGFLGELNIEQETELFVNLRCMQIDEITAKIYVGGGITKDSLPEKEWEETVIKSAILSRFLV